MLRLNNDILDSFINTKTNVYIVKKSYSSFLLSLLMSLDILAGKPTTDKIIYK